MRRSQYSLVFFAFPSPAAEVLATLATFTGVPCSWLAPVAAAERLLRVAILLSGSYNGRMASKWAGLALAL